MTALKRILITPGEPGGIGPDITLQIAQLPWAADITVIADPQLLLDRARLLNIPIKLVECDIKKRPTTHQIGRLNIIPVTKTVETIPGKLNPANAGYVLETLTIATNLALAKKVHALVTGPVHKAVINEAGIPFSGHTEYFGTLCKVKTTVMLFIVDNLKVALTTTHLPLKDVSKAITSDLLTNVLTILENDLQAKFAIPNPRILVCGLNPHAGENGYLGREEIETIKPTMEKLREQGHLYSGPLPADTIFTPHHLKQADAVLAMYHDQALPLVKYIGFDHAVNMTLGLPFTRTSVDHGTALDIAGTGQANADSLKAALKLALELK